ncbi:hypothetical protein GKE82_15215 [Conexibacter sp. W3-3-2]|nr:hypothetical protein [Conexibacter sp. W3-3-2]
MAGGDERLRAGDPVHRAPVRLQEPDERVLVHEVVELRGARREVRDLPELGVADEPDRTGELVDAAADGLLVVLHAHETLRPRAALRGIVRRVPDQLAILDGVVVPAAEARIPATDPGLLRGDGVFEVARLYAGRLFAWEDHLERLVSSARTLRLPLNPATVDADVRTLLQAADPIDGAVRVLVTMGGTRLAMIEPLRKHADSLTLATVTYAPTRVLDGVKSLSYAANMLAGRVAQEQGADDALLVTPHGRVLEAPTSSFFYALTGDQHLYTPPLDDHILDSITRRRVLALTGATERITTRDDLARLEEAFLASTLREVQAITAIDGAWLPATPGARTVEAAARFRAHVTEELAAA